MADPLDGQQRPKHEWLSVFHHTRANDLSRRQAHNIRTCQERHEGRPTNGTSADGRHRQVRVLVLTNRISGFSPFSQSNSKFRPSPSPLLAFALAPHQTGPTRHDFQGRCPLNVAEHAACSYTFAPITEQEILTPVADFGQVFTVRSLLIHALAKIQFKRIRVATGMTRNKNQNRGLWNGCFIVYSTRIASAGSLDASHQPRQLVELWLGSWLVALIQAVPHFLNVNLGEIVLSQRRECLVVHQPVWCKVKSQLQGTEQWLPQL